MLQIRYRKSGQSILIIEISTWAMYVLAQLVAVTAGIFAILAFVRGELNVLTITCALFVLLAFFSLIVINVMERFKIDDM